jgi:hypothetical protein
MATESISRARSVAGGAVSQTNGNAQRASSSSSGERSRARSSQAQAASRQVINIDGKSFDRYAPRGTYLNIIA